MMPEDLRSLLEEIDAWGRAHDASEVDHGLKMLNLEPETAQLVSLMARAARRTRVLEVGTSNGYSTLWLAWSMSLSGGRVVSIERNEAKRSMAARNLDRAGLRSLVDLRLGEADDVIDGLEGPFDLVFFDADRVGAAGQLRRLLPRLTPDALVLADNVLSHPDQVAGYLSALAGLVEFDSMVVPVGKGLSVAYRSVNRGPG
jgi:predicted O-methyltransferase YrrM